MDTDVNILLVDDEPRNLDVLETILSVPGYQLIRAENAEQRVQELNEQLAQRVSDLATANTELEAFSYSVSHDLRAPLRQTAGFVNLLKRAAGDRLDPNAAECLPLIHNAVTRMGQLIDDLLAFSQVGRTKLHLEQISLGSLVDQTRHVVQSSAEGRNVEWKIDPLPEVRVDAATLRQVLVNLLDNALKFTRSREKAVVLLDIKLPRLDGLEVLQEMRANPTLRLVPVVILTSSRQESDLRQAYELGANGYMVKTIHPEDYDTNLRALGQYWGTANEPPPGSLRPPKSSLQGGAFS